jgi:GT2 family glycosyltransferase
MFAGTQTPTLSLITATLQRREYIKNMIASARASVYPLSYNFIICDGGSTDGTQEWCKEQRDIRLVELGKRTGAVHSFNTAFENADGLFVASLNDDCLIYGDVFCKAIEQLERDRDIGQIAIPFKLSDEPSPKLDYIPHNRTGRKWLYANFGVMRRDLGNKLKWWRGLPYSQYAGDAHLSMMVWDAGYKVVPLEGSGYILHLEANDSTRVGNTDSSRFYEIWNDWHGQPDTKLV